MGKTTHLYSQFLFKKNSALVSYHSIGIKKIEYTEKAQSDAHPAIVMEYLPPIKMTIGKLTEIVSMEDFMREYQRDQNRTPNQIPKEFHNLYGVPYEMLMAIYHLHTTTPEPIYHGHLNSLNKLLLWRGNDQKLHIKVCSWGNSYMNKYMKEIDIKSSNREFQFIPLEQDCYSATPEELSGNYGGLETNSLWIQMVKDIYQIFLLIDTIYRNKHLPRLLRDQHGEEISQNAIPELLKEKNYFHDISKKTPSVLKKIDFFALHPDPKKRPKIETAVSCVNKRNFVPKDGFKDWEQYSDRKPMMK